MRSLCVAGSARRHTVKANVKKTALVKKPVVKAKAVPAKTATAKKPAAKTVGKTVAKTAAKPAVKPAGKAAAKPVGKPASKPTSKAAVKAAGKKVVVGTAAKPKQSVTISPKKITPSTKVAAKPVAKSSAPVAKTPIAAVKAANKVQVAQSGKSGAAAKPVPTNRKVSTPSVINKPVTPVQPAKALAKAPAKAATPAAKPAAKPVAKQVAQPVGKAAAPASSKPMVSPSAPAPAKPRTSKSGFISPANIAPKSMEVSTAAKTNFTMSTPDLAPPPQLVVIKDAKLVNNWKKKTAAELTDAEAIAMPDSEYMSPLQLAFFRLKLVQLKKDILSNAGETTEHLREDTTVVPDPADRATIEEEHALELRTRDRERKLLKKIEQSIARIDADDYGYCDETGEPIGVARLIARPTATLSLEAQQRRELKQKMFGD